MMLETVSMTHALLVGYAVFWMIVCLIVFIAEMCSIEDNRGAEKWDYVIIAVDVFVAFTAVMALAAASAIK